MRHFLVAALCAAALWTISARSEEISESERLARLSGEGMEISQEAALVLEKKLSANPDDISSRAKLIGYYQFKREQRGSFLNHIQWLVEHAPQSPLARSPFIQLSPEEPEYKKLAGAWDVAVQKNGKNDEVLGNAGIFFCHSESLKAEKLLQEAQKLKPAASEWHDSLADVYEFRRRSAPLANIVELASRELQQREKACEVIVDEAARLEKRFYKLGDMAEAALLSKQPEKATKYATELLALAPKFQDDWNYGNAIYYGNEILGRLALQEGKLDKAKDFLLLAGKTKGSPQLDSFGPQFNLAKELLAKGEKETVLQFLKLCGKFWKMGGERLNKWTAEVEAGKIPNFEAHD